MRENAPAPLETSLCAKIPPLCRKRQNRSSVLRKNASLSCGNENFFLYLCRHKIPAHFYARNAPALPISFLCAKIPRSVGNIFMREDTPALPETSEPFICSSEKCLPFLRERKFFPLSLQTQNPGSLLCTKRSRSADIIFMRKNTPLCNPFMLENVSAPPEISETLLCFLRKLRFCLWYG